VENGTIRRGESVTLVTKNMTLCNLKKCLKGLSLGIFVIVPVEEQDV